jgi:hypothetical protein
MTTIILAGLDSKTLTRTAHPPFAAAGFDVAAVVETAEGLADAVALAPGALVVVQARMYGSPEEAAARLKSLAPARVVVVLPRAWEEERALFARMPNLVEGHTEPVTWAQVAASAKGVACSPEPSLEREENEKAPPTTGERSQNTEVHGYHPPRRRPAVRLGFYGARGGTGVSTTALSAAQVLAASGQRVGLFDASGRGDLHVMLGLQPAEEPCSHEGITLFLTAPDEETAGSFDAVIVDGGRVWGDFNAQWIVVDHPFSEERIRRLVGLPARQEEQEQDASSSRERQRRPRRGGLNLANLLSIEVTE